MGRSLVRRYIGIVLLGILCQGDSIPLGLAEYVLAAHTEDWVAENNIFLSELFITITGGEIRLVFWHPTETLTKTRAKNFMLKFSRVRETTREEVRMFFDLYGPDTIKRHARAFARHQYEYGQKVEMLPLWFTIVTKSP